MTDSEINLFLNQLCVELGSEFALKYQAPIVSGSGHALELESPSCLGTISAWAAGAVDWHVFDIQTSTEALLGHAEPQNLSDFRTTVLDVFRQIREYEGMADN